ncbi:MAG TPA: winged helix-turn-helix domain-containing protein [Candidatus Acidoferrales bacterium]|nr:winged helix-turn-helix domain-containing protein [Candidatus Acidoferrales bacterium]
MPQTEDRRQLRFGDFAVNPRARTLHRLGIRLKLHRQPFELLLLLLEYHGEVVTREQLQAKLWPSNTFVDFEHGLNTAIKKLRQTLGDSADEPRFIETVPRIGYRFIAQVDAASEPVPQVALDLHTPAEQAGGKSAFRDRIAQMFTMRKWQAVVIASLVLVIGLGAYFVLRRSRVDARPADEKIMLAVLPFDNLTGDAGQDYFSDGLTEEMISQLGRLEPEHIGVIARTSVMYYKDRPEPLDKIGQELGVAYVLEGSVRRDSQNVRISAQLIQVKDQTHVWARQYDRQLGSLLSLQGEIAQEIADEIQLALDGSHKRVAANPPPAASSTSYEAYDFYLKGLYFWNKRTISGFQQAIQFFQKSINKDPRYAKAYAGLADSYAMMCSYNAAPPSDLMPKARAAALTALQLDDSLAEAHTALAIVAQNYDWDWQTADKEYRRAIQLDPQYATAHQWYAESLAFQGHFNEALAESERARQIDPLSLIVAADNGAILYFSRQYDRAIERLRSVLDMEQGFPRASILVFVYAQKGSFADALNSVNKWPNGRNMPWEWAMEAYIYGRSGQKALAERALMRLEEENRHRQVDQSAVAAAYVGVGKKDEAIACLQKALTQHLSVLTTLKADPVYDPLRADPRFQAILRRVGLAE